MTIRQDDIDAVYVDEESQHSPENPVLIRFDRRVCATLVLFSLIIIIFAFLKIHGSSIHCWVGRIPGDEAVSSGVIFGEPRVIRSDEWNTYTLYTLSQYALGFPTENESIGAKFSTLLSNVPIGHYTTFFRPQFWSFFLFDVESAFSIYWSYKTIGLIASSFLLFLLITQNKYWLSLFGALWIFLSSFIQWWFSVPFLPGMLTSVNVLCVAIIYVMFSNRRAIVGIASLVVVVFGVNFFLYLYLPFLIPTFYFAAFLCAGFVLRKRGMLTWRHVLRRSVVLAGAAVAVALVLGSVFVEARETISLVESTLHPGVRVFQNGGVDVFRLFWGFYGGFLTPSEWPWLNICESASFLLFFPVVMIEIVGRAVRGKGLDPLEVCLLVFTVLMAVWLVWGYPSGVAVVTFLNKVHSRGVLGVGLGSIALTLCYLANPGHEHPPRWKWPSVFVGAYIVLTLYGRFLESVDSFFTPEKTLFVAVMFAACSAFLVNRQRLTFSLVVLAMLAPNFLVNPVVSGLAPVLKGEFRDVAVEIARKDPDAKWIVFRNVLLANYLKASGVVTVNGKIFPPDLDLMRQLNSDPQSAQVYNRAAFINALPTVNAASDQALFRMGHNHFNYDLEIDPCSQRLASAGIKFLVIPGSVREWSSCLRVLARIEDVRICVLRDQSIDPLSVED